jgi:hypothetical protein
MTHFLFNMLLSCMGNFYKQKVVFQICMWSRMMADPVNSKVPELGTCMSLPHVDYKTKFNNKLSDGVELFRYRAWEGKAWWCRCFAQMWS